jgi:RNA polymerase sigma factor (sigma-70 family)
MSVAEQIRSGQPGRGRHDPARLVSSLFEEHRHRIYRLCLGMLRSPQDADDAVQQTFINALRAVESGVLPRCEAAWLAEIARNVCRERYRAAARRARRETVTSPDDLGDLPARSAADLDDIGALGGALDRLDPRQRTALVLREWRGLSYKEIGGMLQLSHGAAEALVSRARRSLQQTFEGSTRIGPCLNLVGLVTVFRRWLAGSTAKAAAVAACGVTIATAPMLERRIEHRVPQTSAEPARSLQVRPADHHARARARPQPKRRSSQVRDSPTAKRVSRAVAPTDAGRGGATPAADPTPESGNPVGPVDASAKVEASPPAATVESATASATVDLGIGAGALDIHAAADVSVDLDAGAIAATTTAAIDGGVTPEVPVDAATSASDAVAGPVVDKRIGIVTP